jgi:acyl-CoA synthetase (AMP-forming)/AMP-acid ligase II
MAGHIAFRFLIDGETEESVITFAELDRRARSIAVRLQANAMAGHRALLLFPPGMDFITAFFGCLYAGVIAVPAYPPHPVRPEKSLAILQRIVADATPTLALVPESVHTALAGSSTMTSGLLGIRFLVTDKEDRNHPPDDWRPPAISADSIAFLQYTSGSTSLPKGVILHHSSLLHNLKGIHNNFGLNSHSHCLVWLPPYHDMGLIGGILQPVFSGVSITLMPHMLFLQRPLRWLQAISRMRATVSGGPNFAYDLCLRKIKPEQRETLDLSCWQVAFNGAEPVSLTTMERFAAFFAPCGFRREAFFPCYGLAESTLLVAGGPPGRPTPAMRLLQGPLLQNRVQEASNASQDTVSVVSCGRAVADHTISIVHGESRIPCEENEIGEIWVSGPSVAGGYWKKPSETAATFECRLRTGDERPFLRTGDLGFLHEGELYVTGRIKNLIIREGKNHYPHDIERTIEAAHPLVQAGRSAVFAVPANGGEELVVLVEMEHMPGSRKEELLQALRGAVSEDHGLTVHDIRLVKPGGIPRTTSGKVRHFLCREHYLAGTLNDIVAI